MLGPGHSHAPRVRLLLEEAARALKGGEATHFGPVPIGLRLTLRCPRDHKRGDATNYLGGIADVLEDKAHRGSLGHLGQLAQVGLYANDRQIEEVAYRWEPATDASYAVELWPLEPE